MQIRLSRIFFSAAMAVAGVAPVHAEGLYVGGDVGKPNYSTEVNGIGGGGGGQGTGVNVYGGWELAPHFAVEGGVRSIGRTSDPTGTARSHDAYLDGVASYEFAPHWSLLGRLGLADGHFTTTAGDDRSLALKAGAGLEYDLTRQVGLRLQYERYHYTNAFDGKPDVGEYAFGIKVGF